MTTALAIWLKETGTPQAKFAKRIKRTQPHVSRLARGHAQPDLADLFAIERETKGEVPVSAWRPAPVTVSTPAKVRKVAKRAVRRASRSAARRPSRPVSQ